MDEGVAVSWYSNSYQCQRCQNHWESEWSCMCNDRCPFCNLEMSPIYSVDLSRSIEPADYSRAGAVLPSPLWPPAVALFISEELERTH